MTIASTVSSVQYLRNGTTTQWGWPNKIFSAADLTVSDLDTSVPPIATPLVLGVDYTVQNVDVDTGATVTTTVAGIAGHTLDVRSNISLTQLTSIKNQGSYLPELHEEFFDRITRISQDTYRKTYLYGIHGPDNEVALWPALPTASTRRGTVLAFDPITGLPTAGVPNTQVITTGLLVPFLGLGQTAAEFAAGVTPTNYYVPTHLVLGYVSADRYGPDPTGVIDATAIIQAALNVGGVGSTVWIPPGTYRINGTLNKFAGQIVKGASWATTPLTYVLAPGSTVLKQYSVADIPLIQQVGVSDAAQVERGGLEDIALINNVAGAAVGTAYYTNFARQQKIDNVYISSFSKGMVFDNVSWLMQVNHCRIMDFTKFAVVQNSASEDNIFTNCQFSGYFPQSVALSLNNELANTTFINCYFQGCNYGIVMSQGDTNGNGTGIPFPMHASFIGCLMEDIIQAGFVLVSSQLTPAGGNVTHPGLTIKHLRAFNSGNFFSVINITGASGTGTVATLNWTQPITAAQIPPVGSQITVSTMVPAGYNGSFIVTASSLTSVSFTNVTTGFTSGGTFVYGAQANNNQSLIYAQHASMIDVQDVYANGFSYGATLMGQAYSGVAGFQYGYFYTVGTSPVGPVFWSQDK